MISAYYYHYSYLLPVQGRYYSAVPSFFLRGGGGGTWPRCSMQV